MNPDTWESMAGWWASQQIESVPIAERCWKCDRHRVADDSAAGLCHTCRDALRSAQDAA